MPQQKKTTVTATKSNLTIPNLPNVAKKKNARKRPRAEGTEKRIYTNTAGKR